MTDRFAPRAVVRVAGTLLAADVSARLLSVRYDNNTDLADMVTLVLDDSDHRFVDGSLFDIGHRLELSMGYGSALQEMMRGRIASIAPSFPAGGAATLTVTAYDLSQRLRHDTVTRPPWQGVNDAVIAARIAGEAGLVPVVDPSRFDHERKLPHEGTDWEFLQRRARANHFDLFVRGEELHFHHPRPQTEARVLEWGATLAGFTPRLSAAAQAGTQVVRGFDDGLGRAVVGVASAADLGLEQLAEKLGDTVVESLVGAGLRIARGEAVTSPLDAATLARSLLEEISEGLYEGSGETVGDPGLRAGDQVEIRGVGKRFSGRYRLRQVTHTYDGGGYRTSFEVSQRWGTSLTQLLRSSTSDTAAPGQAPTHAGVVVGVVVAVDPESHRVEVELPGRSEEDRTDPVPCVALGAGPGRGVEFLPSVNDQVLVAFLDGRLATPVVLGSLWTEAEPPSGTADVRRIRTTAHTVTLDDTEGKEQVVISDKGGSTVTMSHDGTVTVRARHGLVLDAGDGDAAITARNVTVTVAADGHMDVDRKA
ncbi:phage baseplate assembly protein V [Pseudonocardia endophytica]|uniref:Phage protein D n=1 Tax=Pseudonocardia endophytica TaxID=401976 RepID=A0A4R1HQU8_PSEEN|nr:phage baseplate assembly protein V [Pseudonocardia endophytica]TCK22870.1 phage protein D [Pseudonocardia endophytica]